MKKIKEYYENCDFSKREYVMSGVILFLLGIIIGGVFSPKHSKMVGCNNGNNCGNALPLPPKKKHKDCGCGCKEEGLVEIAEDVLDETASIATGDK